MQRPRESVRIQEVTQFALVRAAGAVRADWGADVISIEHVERGDAQRALIRSLVFPTSYHGSALTGCLKNAQTKGPHKGYSIAGTADRLYASMCIPSASSLPNKGCRYG
jgi:hypothetical protein